MKKYKLLVSKYIDILENMINQRLEEGWELYGNPIIKPSSQHSYISYGQAMTFREIWTFEKTQVKS